MERIGLIAGNRKFPLIFAQRARQQGFYIVAIAIKADTSKRLKDYVNKIYWIKVEEFNKVFEIFKEEGVSKIAMAGQVNPGHLFNPDVIKNPQVKILLEGIKDRKADTLFGFIAKRLEESGLKLLDSTIFIKDLLPQKGLLTKNRPTDREWQDISFGFEIAKQMGGLDIGQTVAVKDKAIVAVEALEGTDALIRRAARIAKGGVVIVKVSKPKQDMRFDIPVIGLRTITTAIRAGVSSLAIEADKTLFIDREKSLRLADRRGISVVSV